MKTSFFRHVGLGLALILFLASGALAQDKAIDSLASWEGTFLSQKNFWDGEKAKDIYSKISAVAKKKGHELDAAAISKKMGSMYFTDFKKMKIHENTISFTAANGQTVSVPYEFKGELRQEAYGHKIRWYAFQASAVDGESMKYRYVLLMEEHKHAEGQPHFHMRYGAMGFAGLMEDASLEKWWPTLVHPDFDFDKSTEKLDPAVFLRFLM